MYQNEQIIFSPTDYAGNQNEVLDRLEKLKFSIDFHTYEQKQSIVHEIIQSFRQPNGLYVASPSYEYTYIWIRDVCYTVMPYLTMDQHQSHLYVETYHALLDLFHKFHWKIQYHTKVKPIYNFEYLHPRYTLDCDEVPQPWGNAQHDATGMFLYGIGCGLDQGLPILRNDQDKQLLKDLVDYLITAHYWEDPDNGIWEENVELHASSIGACVAGLLAMQKYIDVDFAWIQNGLRSLFSILPRESASKQTDLALLSLIYPYRLLPKELAHVVIKQIEQSLARTKGVIRYEGDLYYAENGFEAEWCFGFPWLGLCYAELGDRTKARNYLQKTEFSMVAPGCLPELYIGGSDKPNGNTPLVWGVSMYFQLLQKLQLLI